MTTGMAVTVFCFTATRRNIRQVAPYDHWHGRYSVLFYGDSSKHSPGRALRPLAWPLQCIVLRRLVETFARSRLMTTGMAVTVYCFTVTRRTIRQVAPYDHWHGRYSVLFYGDSSKHSPGRALRPLAWPLQCIVLRRLVETFARSRLMTTGMAVTVYC